MAIKVSENKRRGREYEHKKNQLIKNLKELQLEENSKVSLQKDTSNLFRHRQQKNKKIDVRKFNEVIAIDPENYIAEVEGMTTFETLVKSCLPHSRLPAVVPELKSITIGGALAGGAIESSSFRHGLVHENILEFEVLLSDGQVVTCRPDNEHRDLFYGFPNSYGTLGYALKAKVKLVPTQSYVKLSHRRFTDSKLFFNALEKLCQTDNINFVEGVIFKEDDLYLSQGEFTNTAPFTSDYQYRKIYYKSIAKNKTDYLTAKDYIWRWDADWFWCSKFFYMQNPVLRLIFGKLLLKSTAYWKIRNFVNRNHITRTILEKAQQNSESVIQDVQIPIQHAAKFLDFFQQTIGIKPIWICPTMPNKNKALFSLYPLQPDTLYINFGFWDLVATDKEDGYYNRLIENKVRELDGYKGLYSNAYYTETEFWDIYNQKAYMALKNKYDPKNRFGNLYQKCIEK